MTLEDVRSIAELLVARAANGTGPVDDATWDDLRRVGDWAKARAIAPRLVELAIPSRNDERSWPKVMHGAYSILSALRPSDGASEDRFSVGLLNENDSSGFDLRIYEIEVRNADRLVRTFTGKVSKSQATRPEVERNIARWCELNAEKLPNDGGTITIDLASISI